MCGIVVIKDMLSAGCPEPASDVQACLFNTEIPSDGLGEKREASAGKACTFLYQNVLQKHKDLLFF